mmetsp:Transcript_18884/g.31223  ORF Transcript_18884/g.31223 Transcript_18884/m.31223 type:complete len:468 (+) Transcript_18884:200-1603(+)|eukprot:CAMPEP_0119015490 /NCGR_PEP_ID=MMETSP1176-20130426/11129_1 /TAXON_ID=265551 /ORGANISM="Synedropsis recta cf, Strain CCMP1620" /LENGTH=467 /DNA_ID=CAMNT_0006968787 /DNA_START=198 /DNA_END=1601 /DNA_ORIENTATION=-
MTTEVPEVTSVQDRAEKLLAEADVVHQSSNERKEMLEGMMDQNVLDSNSSLNDSAQSLGETDLAAAEKKKQEKKSRFQTVSELKQQVQDCQKALLTMQENANLKYRKLELQIVETRSAFDLAKSDLAGAKMEIQNLEKEKGVLQESLQETVGKDQADWLEQTKLKTKQLEDKLAEVKVERDQAEKNNVIMKKVMTDCSQCVRKVPHRPASSRNLTVAPASWWSSVSSAMMGLNEEAEATPASPQLQRSLIDPTKQPPPEMFEFQEQTHQIKEDLEAGIEAMERQMKDDVDLLKDEWSKPSTKSSGRRRRHGDRKKHRKSKDGEGVIGGIGSLDAFFASASQGLSLESEEMDEEQSFYGSRSIASAPVGRRRKKKKHSSQHRHTSRKSSSASDDGNGNGDDDINRRGHYGSKGRSMSFRENFKASLIGLGDEVSVTEGSSVDEPDRFDDLQREVAEWGGGANHAVTVL